MMDHILNLLINAVPVSLAAFGIKQNDRHLFQDRKLHIAQCYSQLLKGSQTADIKNRKRCHLKPFLPAVSTGGLKDLTKIDIGGHGLIGNIQKIGPGQNTAVARKRIGLLHDTAATAGNNADALAPECDQCIH